MDLISDPLLQMALDTAEAQAADVPGALEERVLAEIRSGTKPMQHPAWAVPDGGLTSLQAFITTASELSDLLDRLGPDEWTRWTPIEGETVRDVVEHLVGVERYVLGQLGRRPLLEASRREDHWPVAKRAAAALAAEPAPVVAGTWWLEVMAVISACGELGPDHPVAYHHLAGPVSGLLVVRTFELWTHGDDIRHATDRALALLDDDRLSLMVNQLMQVLPAGLALSGCPQPGRTARLELTGPGGGTFDVALAPDEATGDPDITLTAGAIDICRWASNRLARTELDVVVEGDHALLEPILVGATAFAAD